MSLDLLGRTFRFGEASHPGPSLLRIATSTPTRLRGKESLCVISSRGFIVTAKFSCLTLLSTGPIEVRLRVGRSEDKRFDHLRFPLSFHPSCFASRSSRDWPHPGHASSGGGIACLVCECVWFSFGSYVPSRPGRHRPFTGATHKRTSAGEDWPTLDLLGSQPIP